MPLLKRKNKILLTGGGSGGHIYPLLAVADEILERYNSVDISYIGPYSQMVSLFRDRNIRVFSITSSKFRRYFSLKNFLDIFKFCFSLIEALFKLLILSPDIVFSKGGPGALPVVIAAKIYFIPVIIHESDIVPSLNSRWSSKMAKRIGVSFKESINFFPENKVFLSGNPTRKELFQDLPSKKIAKGYFGLNMDEPVLFVIGGSQGSVSINSFIADNLERLVEDYQIIHQVGINNLKKTKERIYETLSAHNVKNDFSDNIEPRYKIMETLNVEEMKNAFSASDIVISRAGAGSIFEIAAFGKPSIVVPLEGSADDHQLKNAHAFEKFGGTVVLEQPNLKKNIFLDIVSSIINDKKRMEKMSLSAKQFYKPDAAKTVVQEIVHLLNG